MTIILTIECCEQLESVGDKEIEGAFQLDTAVRTFVLVAETRADMKQWVHAFQQCAPKLRAAARKTRHKKLSNQKSNSRSDCDSNPSPNPSPLGLGGLCANCVRLAPSQHTSRGDPDGTITLKERINI